MKLTTLKPRVATLDTRKGMPPPGSGQAGGFSNLYSHRRWRRKREEQLYLQPLCEFCARRGVVKAATTADHVQPHRGDLEKFWYGALQSLCAPCHSGEKQRQEKEVGA